MHTDPATIPRDVRMKLLAVRDALIRDDFMEAYHQLYAIADPEFSSITPWAALEQGFTEVGEQSLYVMDVDVLCQRLAYLLGRPVSTVVGSLQCRADESYGPVRYRCFEVINANGGLRDYLHGEFTLKELQEELIVRIKRAQKLSDEQPRD